MGPIFTTCLVFSLFSIPSRRPLVMPATFRSLVPLIMWLSWLRVSCIGSTTIRRTYLLALQRKHLWPPPESISFLRPPTMLQSLWVSCQEEQSVQWYRRTVDNPTLGLARILEDQELPTWLSTVKHSTCKICRTFYVPGNGRECWPI